MTEQLISPPVLSTPDRHIFDDPTPQKSPVQSTHLTDEEIHHVYEISRTAKDILQGRWSRIALQFPDGMLHDAPQIYELLQIELESLSRPVRSLDDGELVGDLGQLEVSDSKPRLCILADTSYGACCVDEIAAEHVEADVVVHYGRSCLSPTARLPVIYVFTTQILATDPVVEAFEATFPEKDSKIILMADITYSDHVSLILKRVKSLGYSKVFAPSIIHDPSSPLPNRTIPPDVEAGNEDLKNYQLFHISDPPESLLLTLSSRLSAFYIYPTNSSKSPSPKVLRAETTRQLRRRYALLTSLSTCSIFGILINTLSVKNYLSTVSSIQAQIAAAGKKSYTFVVGKINAAKVANFSEIGGWVVIGCWESSLIESTEFYKPIITPFELGLALMNDEDRIWTGEWTSDFSSTAGKLLAHRAQTQQEATSSDLNADDEEFDEEESEPPEFDLRTGRYVNNRRPMKPPKSRSSGMLERGDSSASQALTKRANGDLAMINGAASPGAEYLRSQRTWKGLGSDFEIAYENDEESPSTTIEQGRSGIARGYRVGEDGDKS